MNKSKTKSIQIGIIVIGVIVIMGVFGLGMFSSYRNVNEEKRFVMEGINEIQVIMTSIPVHIIRTETDNEVKFHLHGKSKRGIILLSEMTNDIVIVKVKRQFDGLCIEEVFLDVYIPKDYGKNLLVKTTSGTVKVDPIHLSSFTLNTSSGGLEAQKLTVENIAINTTSGNLNIKEVDTRELMIKGSSSDVLINCREFNSQNISIKTTSGNVTLEIPGTAEFSYEIVRTSGKLKSDFPMNTSENTGKRYLEGQIGNQNTKVSLQTSSGNIMILKSH